MSTNARISIKNPDGTITSSTVHWDGYCSHTGKILKKHYGNASLARELIALGGLSSIGPEIGLKHDFDWADKYLRSGDNFEGYRKDPLHKQCNAYHRDRKEPWSHTKPQTHKSLDEMMNDRWEFEYHFDGGEWMVMRPYRGKRKWKILTGRERD